MKKLIIIFLIAGFIATNAQTLNPKWIKVWDLPEQQVFVDTTTIKQYENQIAVLSISFYKEPQLIASINKKASSIKSRVLFNIANQKFSVIGTLYYDSQLRILAESSLPGSSTGGEAFAVPIDSNQVMVAVYAYCVNFLNTQDKKITEDFSIKGDKTKSVLEKAERESIKRDELVKTPTVVETITPVDKNLKKDVTPKDVKKSETSLSLKKEEAKKEVVEQKPKTVEPAKKDSSIKIVESNLKKDDALKTLVSKKQEGDKSNKETNPKSTIFTDGNKYSFQISSWKNKIKAESEVNRLKKEGHNAFLVEAFVAERKGTWYRVRIGYFNSIEETESYMKKLK